MFLCWKLGIVLYQIMPQIASSTQPGLLNQNLLILTYPSVIRMNSSVICQKRAIPFQIKITYWQSTKDIIPINDQGLN